METNKASKVTHGPYIDGIIARHGIFGLATEARRLMRKMDAAAACYRDGVVKEILGTRDMAERLEAMERAGDIAGLARETKTMSDAILEAQRKADPCGRASLILHTSEEHWERYPNHDAYRRALETIA